MLPTRQPLQTQLFAEQVFPVTMQFTQLAPPLPHAFDAVPGWQVVPLRQPSQAQLPLLSQ